MKNIIKSGLALGVVGYTNMVSATTIFGDATTIGGAAGGVDTAIENLINAFFNFLYLIAVLYAIWGGFNILTAGGDEEKVKKGKTILIQAILGLVVIFLAASIITWVVNSLLV